MSRTVATTRPGLWPAAGELRPVFGSFSRKLHRPFVVLFDVDGGYSIRASRLRHKEKSKKGIQATAADRVDAPPTPPRSFVSDDIPALPSWAYARATRTPTAAPPARFQLPAAWDSLHGGRFGNPG